MSGRFAIVFHFSASRSLLDGLEARMLEREQSSWKRPPYGTPFVTHASYFQTRKKRNMNEEIILLHRILNNNYRPEDFCMLWRSRPAAQPVILLNESSSDFQLQSHYSAHSSPKVSMPDDAVVTYVPLFLQMDQLIDVLHARFNSHPNLHQLVFWCDQAQLRMANRYANSFVFACSRNISVHGIADTLGMPTTPSSWIHRKLCQIHSNSIISWPLYEHLLSTSHSLVRNSP